MVALTAAVKHEGYTNIHRLLGNNRQTFTDYWVMVKPIRVTVWFHVPHDPTCIMCP
jgi:hypothetical protein